MTTLFASCEIWPGDYISDDDAALRKYTMDAFGAYVLMPVQMAELAIDFDAYMRLSDDDKKNDFRFYGNIRNPEENLYIIEDGNMLCSLRTDGRSLWDDDARWTFLSFGTSASLNGYGSIYLSISDRVDIDSDPVAPGDTSVRIFTMDYGDDPVGLVLCSATDGKLVWNVGTAGLVKDTDGYSGEYMTGSEGIMLEKRYLEAVRNYEYICGGEFLMTVLRNDEPIDMCKAIFKPGLRTEFVSRQ